MEVFNPLDRGEMNLLVHVYFNPVYEKVRQHVNHFHGNKKMTVQSKHAA